MSSGRIAGATGRPPFREFLAGHVVLMDGATGTELYRSGVFINRCYDEVNLADPKLVASIHRAYLDAGADAVETNTFGANRFKLKPYGLDSQVFAINAQGARIARECAGDKAYVAGAIGPLGIRLEPWGKTSLEEAHAAFREQAEALLAGGVDLFVLETFCDLSELHQAVRAVRDLTDLPLIAQLTVREDGHTIFGTPPEVFGKRIDGWPVDALGINCAGPQVALETLEKLRAVTGKPLAAQPNAGTPRSVENRVIYMASPEYMAEYAKRLMLTGASVIGGCCGTTPQSIKAMRGAIRALRAPSRIPHPHGASAGEALPAVPSGAKTVPQVPLERRSKLAGKIARGEFVVSVELTPPRSPDLSRVLDAAREMAALSVDAINIPDGPRASARVSPLATAVRLEREAGIETVLHYCCRDRNMLGMQSDLLGAAALGLKNLLLITGDPPKMGDYPEATAVFDVDAIGLVNIVNALNHGRDIGGNEVDPPCSFLIGVGVNPGALDPELEISRFEWKVKAGAHFAITQPVFDPDQLAAFLGRIAHVKIPVIAGLWPLVSLKNAEFMNNEVPGVKVPEPILARLRAADSIEAQREIGLEASAEILRRVRGMVEGIQVSAPFNRIKAVKRMLEAAGLGKKA